MPNDSDDSPDFLFVMASQCDFKKHYTIVNIDEQLYALTENIPGSVCLILIYEKQKTSEVVQKLWTPNAQ